MTQIRMSEITGFRELRQRITDPRLLRRAMAAIIGSGVKLGFNVAKQRLDGGTGRAVQSLGKRSGPLYGRVWTMMKPARVMSIERGRRPGEFVPIAALIRWKEAVGLDQSAKAIFHQIRRRGTKGKWVLRTTQETVRAALPGIIQEKMHQVMQRIAGRA